MINFPLTFTSQNITAKVDSLKAVFIKDEATTQLPLSSYQGVVIKHIGQEQYCIFMSHACEEYNLLLTQKDDLEAIADWRFFASKLDLPLLIEHEDGELLPAYKMLGKLKVNAPSSRRRGHSHLQARHPRAPMRRKGFCKVA